MEKEEHSLSLEQLRGISWYFGVLFVYLVVFLIFLLFVPNSYDILSFWLKGWGLK